MRPSLKAAMILLVLGFSLFAWFLQDQLKRIEPVTRAAKGEHEIELASAVRDACLAYATVFNRLPPDSENSKLTAALLGQNSRGIAFLSLPAREINDNNEIIDHWGTPLKIVFQGASGIQVISAGPDKVFGTPDDIISNSPDAGPLH
jgi:hypothetical protein